MRVCLIGQRASTTHSYIHTSRCSAYKHLFTQHTEPPSAAASPRIMNFLGFGQSADIDIVFDGSESRKCAEIKTEDGKKEKHLLYYDGETVSGKVNVTLKRPGSKLEHQGIKVELIGQIELYYDRGNHHEFVSLVRELARPGDLLQNTGYPFEFANVEKPYEVYVGSNVRLRYFLRVTIVRRISDIVREVDIAVHTLCSYPEMNCPIKMEVGIEDCLHIEFEYNKSKYHLKDVIVGKIYFLLVRIKIKHMEIAIIKRESTGSGPVNVFTENETIAKYEIMDGAPVKGESIPIRVFLAGYDLTPTMRDINKKFSVRYFLNLVLMDTEDRRYFKQQEITLWRKADKNRKSAMTSSTNPHVPSHLVGSDGNIMGASGKPALSSRSGVVSPLPGDDGNTGNGATCSGNTSGDDSDTATTKADGVEEAKQSSVGLFTEENSPDDGKQRSTLLPGSTPDLSPDVSQPNKSLASDKSVKSDEATHVAASVERVRKTLETSTSLFDDDEDDVAALITTTNTVANKIPPTTPENSNSSSSKPAKAPKPTLSDKIDSPSAATD